MSKENTNSVREMIHAFRSNRLVLDEKNRKIQDESSSASGESDSMVHRIPEALPMLSDLPVYLDDDGKKFILSTLGQEQSEQDNLNLEKWNFSEWILNGEWHISRFERRSIPVQDESSSSSSSGESESEDEESLRQSKIPSLVKLALGREDQKFASDNLRPYRLVHDGQNRKDQQPVVPQPTNYKPKVINDIRAQDHKGRGLFATIDLTDGIMTEFREVIKAEPVKLGGLRDAFSTVASGSNGYHTTLTTVLRLLRGTEVHGGAIFVIVDKEHKNDLKISTLDNDCLYQFCRMNTVRVTNKLFQHLLCAFCTPSESDCWEQSLLDKLATQCRMSSELAALKNQPKDGAFVLSHSGTVLAAAAQLMFRPQHYQLCKADGTWFGTRHSAALATAEWMRFKNVNGVVFVRSNAGGVHVMFPHGKKWKREPQEYLWLGEKGQKLPLILCIEDCK